MTTSPQPEGFTATLDALRPATARLTEAVRSASPDRLRGPSLLPGWSRAHVLSHLTQNALALGNLVTWARTGVRTPMYANPQQRDADIDKGAREEAATLVERFDDTAAALARDLSSLPPEALSYEVELRGGEFLPGSVLPWLRLREVEIHHADLDLDYRFEDWDRAFCLRAVQGLLGVWESRGVLPPVRLAATDADLDAVSGSGETVVSGTSPHLLAWLTGREGAIVHVEGPPTVLPKL